MTIIDQNRENVEPAIKLAMEAEEKTNYNE
jgi:hypothetical protein